jgi:UDP-N-acetylmuramoylalanine--D-glutamate ligase
VVLILGGSFKGIDLQPVVNEVLASNISWVIAIGDTADFFVNNLRRNGFTNISTVQTNMDDIVKEAQKRAKPKSIVLLSTACASFGMFENYEDRGEQFKQVVQELS